MNFLTFKPQFHDSIRALVKTSTIRRSTKLKAGERFALRTWTGRPYGSKMGTLGTAVVIDVQHIELHARRTSVETFLDRRTDELLATYRFEVRIGGGPILQNGQLETLATREGFHSMRQMELWFKNNHTIHRTPLIGVLIRWDPATFELSDLVPPNPERLPGGTTNADSNQPLLSAAPVDRVVGQSEPSPRA